MVSLLSHEKFVKFAFELNYDLQDCEIANMDQFFFKLLMTIVSTVILLLIMLKAF